MPFCRFDNHHVLDVASTAKAHLDKSRSFRSSVPPHAIPALLSSVCSRSLAPPPILLTSLKVFVEDFLIRLEKTNFNIFDPQLQAKNPWNFWRLLYNNYKRKY
jgi:hypothetical protein